jgi:serine/threonine-protein kinase
MERRRAPRDSLGDATQVISRLGEGAGARGEPGGKKTKETKPWNLQRVLLFGAIPVLLAAFVLVVITRQSAPPTESTAQETAQPQPMQQTAEIPTPSVSAKPETPISPEATASRDETGTAEATRTKPLPKLRPGVAEKKGASPQRPGKAAAPLTSTAESRVVTDGPTSAIGSGLAVLSLAVSPWGEVFVDGVRQGVTPPLRELKLSPGKHTILIVNQTFTPYSQTIDVQPDTTHKIKYKFTK